MNLERHHTSFESRSADVAVRGFGQPSGRLQPQRTGKSGGPAGWNARARSAFTLVEVAIALAVIGFALVAIIGILPAGLNVQKENREETIINQEASLWMDAIRQGAQGMDYLTNYVDAIQIITTDLDLRGVPSSLPVTNYFTRVSSSLGPDYWLRSGFRIVGLLSLPTYEINGPTVSSNSVIAFVRSISGGATEKAPQDNPTVRESAFSYRLTCEVVPFIAHAGPWTNHSQFAWQTVGTNDPVSRILSRNAHEIRLQFQWPLRPPYDYTTAPPDLPVKLGSNRQTFRGMIGGAYDNSAPDPLNGATNDIFGFFQTGTFKKRRSGP